MQGGSWWGRVAVIFIAIVSFWLGYQLKAFLWIDSCLDLGGGMNPADYDICVVEVPAHN